MKLMSLKQYMNMSKPALIRKITKTLRKMPKAKLARLCYNITKLQLTRFKTISGGKQIARHIDRKREVGSLLYQSGNGRRRPRLRKTKRKFSRKQLAAQRLFAKRARAGTLKRRRR